MKIGILASGNGTTYQHIYNSIKAGVIKGEIAVVICNIENATVLDRASIDGVEHYFISHKVYPTRQEYDRALADTLHACDVELVVFAGWMRIVTSLFINAFPANSILNVHPSLLPSFKGLNAVEQALDAGVKVTGCTVHYVTEELDSGPIINQMAEYVKPDDTPESLHRRIKVKERQCMIDAISSITN